MGLDPGCGPISLISHAVVATHVKNSGSLAQMLAQGESSSAKQTNKKVAYRTKGTFVNLKLPTI